jgi:YbbR domain-containing protein
MKWLFRNAGYKLLALLAAILLWGVTHGESSVEKGFDIQVVPVGVPANLVITDPSSDTINVRVRGNPFEVRGLTASDLEYTVDLSGAHPGKMSYDVDPAVNLRLPRGTQVVSRSPSTIEFVLERKATKSVRVRADIDGQPADGYKVADVSVDPPRVRITGARSEILRLGEVLTETVDISGATAPVQRKVRLALSGKHIWLDDSNQPITVIVQVVPKTGNSAARGSAASGGNSEKGKAARRAAEPKQERAP